VNLIVQGREVATGDLKTLAKCAGAGRIERIADGAFRLVGAAPHPDIEAHCERASLDFAWVDPQRRLADFGLAVMDMDSTLIAIECIDEIADLQGLKAEVSAITASAMRGELDFAESLRRRVALLAGLPERALQRVYDERLRLSPGAERMLAAFRRSGIRTLLVSGGFTFFTERLKARLSLDHTCSNTLETRDGVLTGRVTGEIVDADRKARELVRVRESLGLARERVIAMGDGANDLAFMAEAGVSIAYRAKPVVQRAATYRINHTGLDAIVNLFAA